MPSRPSSLPGPLVMLVVLAAPVLVLSLLLSLVLVAPLATFSPWACPHLSGLMQIAHVFWRTSPHSTLASQVHRRTHPL